MSAKNLKTGQSLSAKNRNASPLEHALTTYLDLSRNKPARRKTPEEVHAQLILIIGATLAAVFLIVTLGITYALIFVTQPIGAQAENDKMFFGVLSSVATFITGTLAGLMISTGRNKQDPPEA